MVFEEAEMITARINHQMASEAVLFQMAVHSLLSEKMAKAFDKRVKGLFDGEA